MMKRMTMNTCGAGLAATAFAALLILAPQAPSQEKEPQEKTPQEKKPQEEKPQPTSDDKKPQEENDKTDLRDLNPFSQPESGAAELEDLFRVVEKRLKRVTSLLYEASSGDASGADGIGGAGIDELIRGAESEAAGASDGIARMLRATRGQSQATLKDIERILELAEQQGGGSGSQPCPTPSEGMPQQGQTPSGSRKEDKGENPPGSGPPDTPEGDQPPKGDEPKGGQEQEGGPGGPAKAPPESATGDAASAAGAEDWGDLPVHLRQVFQNGVSQDVPPRYRDWVDSYYRRLNRRSGR